MADSTAIRDKQPSSDSDGPGGDACSAPRLVSSSPSRRGRTSARYFVCLGLLVAAAGSMQLIRRYAEAYFAKQRLELLRPLAALRTSGLRPEYDLYPRQPEPLDHDVVETLGTEEYLNWQLIDTRKEPRDRTYLARLFVTYYTGQPDMVPHNPRECQQAGGWKLVGESTERLSILDSDARLVEVPVAVLDFVPPGGDGDDPAARRLTVLYFFYANGRYVTTRTGVRAAVQNLWDRYAYYSKIELRFTSERDGRLAAREESVEAGQELLKKLMPILWDEHFQDWDAIKAGAAPVQ